MNDLDLIETVLDTLLCHCPLNHYVLPRLQAHIPDCPKAQALAALRRVRNPLRDRILKALVSYDKRESELQTDLGIDSFTLEAELVRMCYNNILIFSREYQTYRIKHA